MNPLHRQLFLQALERFDPTRGALAQGGSQSWEQFRGLGLDYLRCGQVQNFQEGFFQAGQKSERTAAEQDRRAHFPAAGQGGENLQNHRLEDRSGNLLLGYLAAEQVLQIRFRKDPAAGGHRVEGGVAAGERVQLGDRNHQQGRHLIQKGPGAPGASPVHAHIGPILLIEKDDFGIFAADIDQCPHLRITLMDYLRRSDHFLNKGQLIRFGNPQTGRAGEEHFNFQISQLLLSLVQEGLQRRQRFCIMAAVG